MKVLLRNVETGLYYEEASKWTPDQTAAFDFEKTTRVVELVFAEHFENVEMLLMNDDPQFDLILPIDTKSSSDTATPVPGAVARKPGGDVRHQPHRKHSSRPP